MKDEQNENAEVQAESSDKPETKKSERQFSSDYLRKRRDALLKQQEETNAKMREVNRALRKAERMEAIREEKDKAWALYMELKGRDYEQAFDVYEKLRDHDIAGIANVPRMNALEYVEQYVFPCLETKAPITE